MSKKALIVIDMVRDFIEPDVRSILVQQQRK